MNTMMALRAHTRGGPEVLVYESAPRPVPDEGEALIEVHAAAITFAELTWDESWQTRDGADRTPTIVSHEVSGKVVELGEGVTSVGVGDDVYGLIAFDRDGAAAEYVSVVAADLSPKPTTVSHVEAAALPLAALTAWQALVDHASVQAGERVLVHGGAGGVGVYGVQLAAHLGAIVTATGRAAQESFVRELGAARFIDHATEAFDEPGASYDVVLDTVGGSTLERSYGVVRPGGRLVTLGAPASQEKADQAGITATFFVVLPDPSELTHLAHLVDSKQLRPVVAATFPLSEGRSAYQPSAKPHRPGKTVLIVR